MGQVTLGPSIPIIFVLVKPMHKSTLPILLRSTNTVFFSNVLNSKIILRQREIRRLFRKIRILVLVKS